VEGERDDCECELARVHYYAPANVPDKDDEAKAARRDNVGIYKKLASKTKQQTKK
jgi:hypothetical protein